MASPHRLQKASVEQDELKHAIAITLKRIAHASHHLDTFSQNGCAWPWLANPNLVSAKKNLVVAWNTLKLVEPGQHRRRQTTSTKIPVATILPPPRDAACDANTMKQASRNLDYALKAMIKIAYLFDLSTTEGQILHYWLTEEMYNRFGHAILQADTDIQQLKHQYKIKSNGSVVRGALSPSKNVQSTQQQLRASPRSSTTQSPQRSPYKKVATSSIASPRRASPYKTPVKSPRQDANTLPAGRYYIGDPSAIMNDQAYSDLIDVIDAIPGKPRQGMMTVNGKRLWVHKTLSGDGVYYSVGKKQSFPVDSGLLGMIPESLAKSGDAKNEMMVYAALFGGKGGKGSEAINVIVTKTPSYCEARPIRKNRLDLVFAIGTPQQVTVVTN
jgi:hypothetical protein